MNLKPTTTSPLPKPVAPPAPPEVQIAPSREFTPGL
jgi:hypothetical protein